MLYTIPDYYKEFHCTADQCEDTCCAGWQIVIDKKSLGRYKDVKGNFRDRLHRSINWNEEVFRQKKDKRCAFLNADNLCDMYTALGEGSLCRTCRLYPRHIEEFEGVREISLSLSCPEAAKILLNKKDPVKFLTYEKDGEEEYEDYDPFLYSQLADVREEMIALLQDRMLSMDLRIALALAIAHDVQGCIQRQQLFSCTDVTERYKREEARTYTAEKMEGFRDDRERRYAFARKTFAHLHRLELLNENWRALLLETEAILYSGQEEFYYQDIEAFEEWKKEQMPEWDILREQIMVYFIFSYFCGAVYDGRVYGKTQMAAFSVFVIEEMLRSRWLKNGKQLDMEEVIEITYRYSRETEHSDKNLERSEQMMEGDRWICVRRR